MTIPIETIFSLIQAAIKEEPAIAAELQLLFTKSNPTDEDWANARANVEAEEYDDYVPSGALLAQMTALISDPQ